MLASYKHQPFIKAARWLSDLEINRKGRERPISDRPPSPFESSYYSKQINFSRWPRLVKIIRIILRMDLESDMTPLAMGTEYKAEAIYLDFTVDLYMKVIQSKVFSGFSERPRLAKIVRIKLRTNVGLVKTL